MQSPLTMHEQRIGLAPTFDTSGGLTDEEVLQRRTQFGVNSLPIEKRTTPWAILFAQFKSPLIYIILVAAVVSLVAGEYGDFGIIMVVVVIDVLLGFVQEYRAGRALEALRKMLSPTITVLRAGKEE